MPKTNILYKKDIKNITPDLDVLSLIPETTATTSQTLAYGMSDEETLLMITTNTYPNLFHTAIDRLEAQWYEVEIYYTDDEWFAVALTWYHEREVQMQKLSERQHQRMTATGEDAIKLIKETFNNHESLNETEFITELIRLAFQAWASDMHFQSEEIGVVMRLRIDGVMQTILVFTHKAFKKYLMKLKFQAWAKMNIWNTTQDWRFDFDIMRWDRLEKIDVRVSILPGLRGESIVLRFLDAQRWLMSFDNLGCEDFHIEILKRQIKETYGLILVTWPTWSWKTTTVYSLLNALNTSDKKIITLEDPVEYELPGIEQSQINEDKGYTFEEGLKGVLRHDPDIIMVWEIRTIHSAELAVNAALTWHLVISTIHTNTATEAITRLLNMGVKPFMLASALNVVVWQRLLRHVAKPRYEEVPDDLDQQIKTAMIHIKDQSPMLELPEYAWVVTQPDKRASKYTHGYQWRSAVFEMLEFNRTLKQAVLENKSASEIEVLAIQQWFLTLKDNARLKMLRWETSLEEIQRVL